VNAKDFSSTIALPEKKEQAPRRGLFFESLAAVGLLLAVATRMNTSIFPAELFPYPISYPKTFGTLSVAALRCGSAHKLEPASKSERLSHASYQTSIDFAN
jgi:hypothetical protein